MKSILSSKISLFFLISSICLGSSFENACFGSYFGDICERVLIFEYTDSYGRNRLSASPIIPSPQETLEQRLAYVTKGLTGKWITMNAKDVPDLIFLSACYINGNTVDIDLDVVKAMRMNKIRLARNVILQKSDVILLKAIESGDSNELARIKQWRQGLRDIPQTFDMSMFDTPELVLYQAIPNELGLSYDEFLISSDDFNKLTFWPEQIPKYGPHDLL